MEIFVGGIYYVADEEMVLDKVDGEYREVHEARRPFVVLSGPDQNGDRSWPTVLGCPISSSTTKKTPICVKLGAGVGGLVKKSWVRIPALQPILKTDLQDRIGVLEESKLEEVQARVLQYMGLLPDDEEPEPVPSPAPPPVSGYGYSEEPF
jgi:mRNA-degrading endonuclease toxin of MazEF toxin-antitoxin module